MHNGGSLVLTNVPRSWTLRGFEEREVTSSDWIGQDDHVYDLQEQ